MHHLLKGTYDTNRCTSGVWYNPIATQAIVTKVLKVSCINRLQSSSNCTLHTPNIDCYGKPCVGEESIKANLRTFIIRMSMAVELGGNLHYTTNIIWPRVGSLLWIDSS